MSDPKAKATNTDKKYIGLWAKEGKNGTFLSGGDQDNQYFVFKSRSDENVKVLHSAVKGEDGTGGPINKIGTLEGETGKNGEYWRFDKYFLFTNDRREKETHPDFNLVIMKD